MYLSNHYRTIVTRDMFKRSEFIYSRATVECARSLMDDGNAQEHVPLSRPAGSSPHSHPAQEAQGSTHCWSRKKPHPFIRFYKRRNKSRRRVCANISDSARSRGTRAREKGYADGGETEKRRESKRERERERERETERTRQREAECSNGVKRRGGKRVRRATKNLGYFRLRSAVVGYKIYTKIQIRAMV